MRALFCGSGGHHYEIDLRPILEAVRALPPGSVVVHSNVPGVDQLAGAVAMSAGLQVEVVPHGWEQFFYPPIQVDHVFAFYDGEPGNTDNLVERARSRMIEVTVRSCEASR